MTKRCTNTWALSGTAFEAGYDADCERLRRREESASLCVDYREATRVVDRMQTDNRWIPLGIDGTDVLFFVLFIIQGNNFIDLESISIEIRTVLRGTV